MEETNIETPSASINLQDVKPGSAKAPEVNQTSSKDGEGAEKQTETKPDGETASGDSKDTGTKTDTDDKPEEGVDYFKKFKASSSEANRLVDVKKLLEEGKITDGAKISQLKTTMEALEKQLKEKDPDGYDAFIEGLKSEATASENAELKLGKELDKFISKTTGAEAHREALKQHRLSNPDKSLDDIWNDHGFKAMAEATKSPEGDGTEGDGTGDSAESTDDATATEDGKGTSTGDPTKGTSLGGKTPEEFAKLPLSERKAILLKAGAKM